MVKNSPAMKETWVQSLGEEDPLETEESGHTCCQERPKKMREKRFRTFRAYCPRALTPFVKGMSSAESDGGVEESVMK